MSLWTIKKRFTNNFVQILCGEPDHGKTKTIMTPYSLELFLLLIQEKFISERGKLINFGSKPALFKHLEDILPRPILDRIEDGEQDC